MAVNGVERYIPHGDLEASQANDDLALVGFSPAFPAQMLTLNTGMTWLANHHAFQGFRFHLNPDEDRPRVDVEAKYSHPFSVTVDAYLNKRASLDIRPRQAGAAMLAMLRLDQLHEFTDTYPTTTPLTFTAIRRERRDNKTRLDLPARVVLPFANIISTEVLTTTNVVPGEYDINLGFKTDDTGLRLDMSYPFENRCPDPVFMVHGIRAEGSSADIEKVIGDLGALIKRNWNIPDVPEAE